jgi:hypothetical protein
MPKEIIVDSLWYEMFRVIDGLHRDDGPAVEYLDGTKEWYKNGMLHREDGPAILYRDGTESWYMHGIKLTEKEFLERTQQPSKIQKEFDKIGQLIQF